MWGKCTPPSTHNLLWSKHGLGQTALKVYAALCELGLPSSVRAIVSQSGSDRRTVNKYLDELYEVGLAVRVEGGRYVRWTVNMLPDWDNAIRLCGAEEHREEMRAKHAEERAEYKRRGRELLDKALESNEFAYESGDLRAYRLSPEGIAAAKERGAAWVHAEIPERYREYAPVEPEGVISYPVLVSAGIEAVDPFTFIPLHKQAEIAEEYRARGISVQKSPKAEAVDSHRAEGKPLPGFMGEPDF